MQLIFVYQELIATNPEEIQVNLADRKGNVVSERDIWFSKWSYCTLITHLQQNRLIFGNAAVW